MNYFSCFIVALALHISHCSENALKLYMRDILNIYKPRSLILVSNPDNLKDNKISIATFYELTIPLYNINTEQIKKFNGIYHKRYDVRMTYEESKIYIVILRKLSEIEALLQELQSIYFWRQRDKILVLTPNEYTPETLNILKLLSFICWRNKMLNISFGFVWNFVTTATYNPFIENNSLNIIFFNHSYVFPDKLTNLYGYKIRISMFPNILDAIPSGNSFKGRDGLMASTVESVLNASFSYVGPSDGVDYGENFGGRRLSGVFGDVANGRTEIAFNSRYLKGEFENLLEATYPHGRDDLTGLVPVIKPSDVKDFGRNFSFQIWLLLIATQIILFCLICILTTLTQYTFNPIEIIGVLFRLMLGQPAQYHQNIASIRLVLISVTGIAFFFEIAYVSQLASVLAVPRKPNQINTLEELANSDLKIFTLTRFRKMLNRTLKESIRQKLVDKLLTFQETEQIDELSEHKFIGAICKEHIAIYVVKQENNYVGDTMFYRIMDEKPMPSIVCYGVRYGSPLLEKLNIIINRLTAAGIPNQWRKLTLQDMSIKGNMYQKIESSDKRTLTLNNLIHVFYCLFFGWALEFAVFLLEKFWTESVFKRN